MKFLIRLGVPHMEELWTSLSVGAEDGTLDSDDKKLFKKLSKALILLSSNPKHNSLHSHEIEPLSRRYGIKVFQSYLENNKPAAGRLFWVYGPGKTEITVIGLEPHPEDDKRGGYEKVTLSV